MSEFNFKDFLLKEDVLNMEETTSVTKEKSKKKSEVEYIVEWASGPDCIILRKTPKTQKWLVLFVSKGQYYIKNNKGEISALDYSNFSSFFDKLDEDLEVNVNWVKYISHKKKQNEYLIGILQDENFQKLAKNNFIFADSTFKYASRSSYFKIDNSFYMSNISLLKKIFLLFCQKYDEITVKKMFTSYLTNIHSVCDCSEINELLFFCFKPINLGINVDEKTGWNIPTRYCDYRDEKLKNISMAKIFFEYYGESGLMNFLNAYIQQGDSGRGYAFNDIENFYTLLQNVEFKCETLIEYLVYERIRQGYSLHDLLQDWKDDLYMQMQLYGKIKEKYPTNLASTHKKHSHSVFLLEKLKKEEEKQINDEKIKERKEKMKSLCYAPNNEKYYITTPDSLEDILEEARNMSNCLASYVKRYANGETDLFFLRSKNDKENSLVDIEVRGGWLQQAYAHHNRKPSQEIMDFIHKWCEAKNINFSHR